MNSKFLIVNHKYLALLGKKDSEALVGILTRLHLLCGTGDKKYLVCNVDEPYAREVHKLIIEGEGKKGAADKPTQTTNHP